LLLNSAGEIYSWGLGSSGALGTGYSNSAFVPEKIKLSKNQVAIEIDAGASHSGFIDGNFQVYFFG